MKYRVIDRSTGKVHTVGADDLARRRVTRPRGVFRRDKLMRLAQKGQLVLVKSYSYDDNSGESRGTDERRVEMKPEDKTGWYPKEGVAYFSPWEFRSSSGAATQNPDGTVTLYVHSNLNFTFRIKAARR